MLPFQKLQCKIFEGCKFHGFRCFSEIKILTNPQNLWPMKYLHCTVSSGAHERNAHALMSFSLSSGYTIFRTTKWQICMRSWYHVIVYTRVENKDILAVIM